MATELLSSTSAEPWSEAAEPTTWAGAAAIPRLLASPAQAEAAAAQLVPRLAAQAAETDVVGAFPTQEFNWLRAAGLLTAALPAALGGAGLQATAATLPLLRVLQSMGQGNLAVGRVYEGHLNALMLIQQLGTSGQVARYAADARAGLLFGVWNTENPADGVHLEALPNGRYRLRGAKTFASGAGYLARPLISGALPEERLAAICAASRCPAAGAGPLLLAALGDAGHGQLPSRFDRAGDWAGGPHRPAQCLLPAAHV
ncbi:acyl-CoA dehydrogenase family protein [Hymenobacter humi]|uniref:Acyl-CoA dehydrogenase family protein n=1 Tax=Hymenobacter humi TaxID=1411620 RepID=A0ABW2UA37_9BACT